jgi:hypothetical protein
MYTVYYTGRLLLSSYLGPFDRQALPATQREDRVRDTNGSQPHSAKKAEGGLDPWRTSPIYTVYNENKRDGLAIITFL